MISGVSEAFAYFHCGDPVKISKRVKGFCQVKKRYKKSEKNSEVGGWVKSLLGLLFVFGNVVLFVFLCCFHVSKCL